MATGPGESTRTPAAVTPLGGVRADFVANLGRRLSELRQHWALFEQEPQVARYRDEVRRRIHALTTRARLLEFVLMADKLDEAERRLDTAANSGLLESEEIGWFHDLFRALPGLAWNDVAVEQPPMSVPSYEPPPKEPPSPSVPAGFPVDVLVVGPEPLRLALTERPESSTQLDLECERTEDMSVALDLARALAPDLVVVDIDLQGARGFVASLAEDPLTEPVPVIVVGSWTHPEQAADLLSLGIVRCLPKPVSPDLLRTAAEQAVGTGTRAPVSLSPLGDLTVEEVADRLVTQLREGLVHSVRPEAKNVRIPLDKGTELLAAVWGAVARVRESLTIRSHGNVRFSSKGPSGAVPIAPWLENGGAEPPAQRQGGRDAKEGEKMRLEGRKALVVDDDPAVTWFLSGLLRSVGAFVYEAHNGAQALEIAFRTSPDLVISDVIMPELDGFELCRRIKRDIALRDAPVILLSWKEDLLQRVRELGARADGYIRKESSGPAILRRVHEVLQPRLRVESRLREGGEVRGRLDGLTAGTLLQLVSTSQPDARITVRDARFVYDVELREGAPRAATRTAQDGAFERGATVLRSLLGIGAGRFYAVPSQTPVRATLQGDLASQVGPLIARARAAQKLLAEPRFAEVRSLKLNVEELQLDALPEQSRALIEALHQGVTPRDLVLSGRTNSSVLEAVLDDAAIRGAIEAVLGPEGTDLLAEEAAAILETMSKPLRLAGLPKSLAPLPQQPELSPRATTPAPAAPSEPTAESQPPEASPVRAQSPERTSAPELIVVSTDDLHDIPEIESLEGDEDEADGAVPTSLTEAVIREVLDPEGRQLPSPRPPPPMLDARELRPRSVPTVGPPIPSLPPDAIVPGPDAPAEAVGTAEPSVPAVPSLPPGVAADPIGSPAGLRAPPVPQIVAPEKNVRAALEKTEASGQVEVQRERAQPSSTDSAKAEGRKDKPKEAAKPVAESQKIEPPPVAQPKPKQPSIAERKPKPEAPRKPEEAEELVVPKRSMVGPILFVLLIVGAIVAGIYWIKQSVAGPVKDTSTSSPALSASALVPEPLGTNQPSQADALPIETVQSAKPIASEEPSPTSSSSQPATSAKPSESSDEDVPLPRGARLPKGTGVLEVRTLHADSAVLVNGREVGTGAVVAAVLRPGQHTVLVRWRGKEVSREATVRADRRTRFTLVPP